MNDFFFVRMEIGVFISFLLNRRFFIYLICGIFRMVGIDKWEFRKRLFEEFEEAEKTFFEGHP